MSLVSKLNKDRSIKIPEDILRKAGLKPGNFAKAMKRLGKELWQDIDVNVYIKEERESWE